MRFVLDASVATCWFFEDEHNAPAEAAAAILLARGPAQTRLQDIIELLLDFF